MKSVKLWLGMAGLALALGLQPSAGWATRALGDTVTGAITASPTTGQIEVAHKVYPILANSPAARAARSFFLGQVVDLILTRPADNAEPEVVSITAHTGS